MAELTLLNGLVGGVVATIGMTVVQLGLGDDSPPPTAVFYSKYLGDGPPDAAMPQGMVLHLLYGTGAGAVFAVGLPAVGLSVASMATAVGLGLVYGVGLFVIAAVLWMRVVLELDAKPRMVAMFLFFHLVYGAVLGAWLELGLLGS